MSEKSITVDVGLTEARAIDSFVTRGDWSQLAPQDRARAYVQVCAQHGLNALSQPFAFLRLNGKEVLYATRGATVNGFTRTGADPARVVLDAAHAAGLELHAAVVALRAAVCGAEVVPCGAGLDAHVEPVAGCTQGRVIATLRERASGRMAHPLAFGEGATRDEAVLASKGVRS